MFYTDKLPAYGVTEGEVTALSEGVESEPDGAVALVADDLETTELAIEAASSARRTGERGGMAGFSVLMGECMGELRGKADGDVASDVLREEIQKRAG